jgi:hypothetical protein
VKEESKLIEMAWQECINKAKSSTIILPLSQIKTLSQDGKVTWLDLSLGMSIIMSVVNSEIKWKTVIYIYLL